MRLVTVLPAFLLALAAAVCAKSNSDITQLKIDVTSKPDSCTSKAEKGDKISVHYTGTLYVGGSKFDSSRDRGSPFDVTLGVGQVIKGWDEGLIGMCVGEKRILTIPSSMAYGSRGFGSVIPADSALVFDVELMKLTPNKPRQDL